MIAFTNHALDHLLGSVLDANITRRIVRLGSQCADERISQFTIDRLVERNSYPWSYSSGQSARAYEGLKAFKREINELAPALGPHIIPSTVLRCLKQMHPDLYKSLYDPKPWIQEFYDHCWSDDSINWVVWGHIITSRYSWWLQAHDLEYLQGAHYPPVSEQNPRESRDELGKFRPNLYSVLNQESRVGLTFQYHTKQKLTISG